MAETPRATDLVRLGRHTFSGRLDSRGPVLRLVFPSERERERRSGSIRLVREAARIGRSHREPPLPLSREYYIGHSIKDGTAVWTCAYEFAPGTDAGTLLRFHGDGVPEALARSMGASIGEALAALDQTGRHCEGLLDDSWAAWVRGAAEFTVGRMLSDPGLDALLGAEWAHRLRSATAALVDCGVLELDSGPALRRGLVHGDLHGGNAVVVVAAGAAAGPAVLIDDQLRFGDPCFDAVAVFNWAFECLEDASSAAFGAGLAEALGLEVARAPRMRLTRYHLVRSLGRLAYYLRDAPTWVEPQGARRLHRHVELLERLAAAPVAADAPTDLITMTRSTAI